MILDRLFPLGADKTPRPGDSDDFWYEGASMNTEAGVRISPESSLQVAAVFACVQVLAETMGTLPCMIYERLRDSRGKRSKRLADGHPLFEVVHDRPNNWQTAQEFREMLTGHCALRGNAYAQIIPGARGAVDQLVPIHPDRVIPVRLPDNRGVAYDVQHYDTGAWRQMSAREIFHLRWLSLDGVSGINRIEQGKNVIGLAKAQQVYGSKLYAHGARPGGILKHPGHLKAEAKSNLRASWERLHGGPSGAFRVAVLEEGLEWQAVGMTAEHAQYLDMSLYSVTDICRLFRMPPHMIAHLIDATFSNIEHQGISFSNHTMLPWGVRWETSINRDLIAFPKKYFCEFVMQGLERGDSKARMIYYKGMFGIGVLSINDIRSLENEPPIDDGDEHYVPLNMKALGEPDPDPKGEEKKAPPAENGEQNRDKMQRAAFDALLEEAASRIAAAEVRAIADRSGKAAEDRDRFNLWVAGFYRGHADYIEKTLAPIATAWARVFDRCPAADEMAEQWTHRQRGAVQLVADVAAAADIWRINLAGELAEFLKRSFCDDRHDGQN